LHRVTEVHGAILALLDHCLITLQERDKSARLLSRDKFEEAFWAKDLPQDFTDCYNKWGLWKERTQLFLNTIPKGKSRAFLALLWFKSYWLLETLFKKMLLKMAGQKKLKGQIWLNSNLANTYTTREITFFQVSNCNAIGLQDTLHRAMTNNKSGMIQKSSTKYPRMEWGLCPPGLRNGARFCEEHPMA
jgi:hypothetical protein